MRMCKMCKLRSCGVAGRSGTLSTCGGGAAPLAVKAGLVWIRAEIIVQRILCQNLESIAAPEQCVYIVGWVSCVSIDYHTLTSTLKVRTKKL